MQLTGNYFQARRAAIAWLNSKRNFEEGVRILLSSGYKPLVCSKLKKWGDRPHSREKLVYEIRQMIQVWANPRDPRFQDVDFEENETTGVEKTVSEEQAKKLLDENEIEIGKEGDENQLPPVIRKVIYEFSQAYKARSVFHREMSGLPEDNNPETVRRRKELVSKIAALSDRMQVLYDIRQEYESNGKLLSEEALNMELSGIGKKKDTDEDKPIDTPLPDTVDGLKRMRKNEATKLTRAKNMLLYQSETKPKPLVENPLPECPKRVKLEKKISRLEEFIAKIDYKIAELA